MDGVRRHHPGESFGHRGEGAEPDGPTPVLDDQRDVGQVECRSTKLVIHSMWRR